MKDIMFSNRYTNNQVSNNRSSSNEIEEEIEKLRTEFSKTEASNDSAWNSSVLRVLFKNESFARKYRGKIEKFLKEILEEGEQFIVYHPSHNNDEQEFEDNPQAFHIDKINNESFETAKNSQQVPVYSSTYEDTFDCNEEEVVEKVEENKPSMVTCFNCLGGHHMKQCPEEIDRARINANKKEILLASSTIRYHTEEDRNLKPGIISDNLQNALDLNKNQLPQFIYHMRVIGYPPGWMNEAILEKSGLSLFDSDGRAIGDDNISSDTGTFYDGSKFIEFPGFNTPVPEGFTDEWKTLNMPPLQPHQQLKEALKSSRIINNNTYKRKQNRDEDVDKKKHKNVSDYPCSTKLKVNIPPDTFTTPERGGKLFEFRTPERISKNGRHSLSISQSPGTPILEQGNPYQRLPDADKFAQGITEHLPFENLPDSTGTFEKMRGVIGIVQRKLNDIKNS